MVTQHYNIPIKERQIFHESIKHKDPLYQLKKKTCYHVTIFKKHNLLTVLFSSLSRLKKSQHACSPSQVRNSENCKKPTKWNVPLFSFLQGFAV